MIHRQDHRIAATPDAALPDIIGGSSDNVDQSHGTASRIEVVVVASVDLLDGQTGALLVHRPGLTFSNQYRLDQNFASFDNRELLVVESLADDFAESFLTQLLEAVE